MPLGTLPRQTLASGQCAVFLWKAGEGARLLLMANQTPPTARIILDGRTIDLPRIEGAGEDHDGLLTHTVYAAGDIRLTLDLTIEEREGLERGLLVPAGSMALERTGQDGLIIPVSGLIGCQ